PPDADARGWARVRAGDRWGIPAGADPTAESDTLIWGFAGDGGSNHWLRASLSVPEAWRGQSVLLALDWDGKRGSSIEAIAYLDGVALAGLDEFHRSLMLPATAHEGTHELLIRCLAPVPQRFGGLSLQLRDETIFRLGHTMRAQLEAVGSFQESDLARHALIERLNSTYNTLDLREGWASQRFADSAHSALQGMEAAVPSPDRSPVSPTIVATGHAHLDVGWLWPVWRTRQKVAHTVATALHLMERYPDYHFSMSQPQVYHFLKHDAPDLYERMKARIAEGRFEPVGMMWLETDCNIPSGESLARQLAHGARFYAQEFPDQFGPSGDPHYVVWLPDVFGYSAALPQLMRGCGISSFMTTKISWSQFNRMPNDTFRWRGIDGSEVLTHFVTASDKPLKHWAEAQFYTYNGMMTGEEAFGTWKHYRQKDLSDEVLYIYGYGDGGGGPTEQMLEAARALDQLPGYPHVKPGRIDQFFKQLYQRAWDDPRLPTWAGELYLEYHRGTYTSQARTKQANRAAELLLREAEWLNAWAVARGAENRQPQLDAAWQIVLLQQFHDILPGSSIPQVYVDSNADFAEVQRIGNEVRQAAAAAVLSAALPEPDLQAAGGAIFNSLPWERREVARIELANDDSSAAFAGPDGAELASQIVEDGSGKRVALVEATVPSYGMTWVSAGAGKPGNASTGGSKLIAQHSKLENGELRLELDEHGEIASLYDLRYGYEAIAPGARANQLVIYEDRPLNWNAWDIDIFYEEKPYPLHEVADWQIVEHGPLRAAIAITRRVGQSTITQRICMWRDSRRIDFITEVDWQERQSLLRALFPINVNATRATCEIQFGAVERPTHRNTSWDWARFEVCAHRWVDLSEGGYGVALLNDGKYGHSLHHNTLGLSLLKGAIAPDPDADRGLHRFTYSLLPHAGDWRTGEVTRRAYELNAPLFTTKDQRPKTKDAQPAGSLVLGPSSFVSSPTDHIVVETVKVAHDGDGLIVRLYEAHNQRGPAALVFGQPLASAVEVDLLEREIGAVDLRGSEVHFQVRPFEVKTLRIRFGQK
ncbi:MAG TPA: glycoside hydrolase family 38 C-terminal domain-containing protein, partial [Roseiflexaceae bacterium]|nr:glycoside hydrolase family 38 C-terminal domain-containing protein [Roseiflexaceae bacterium]